MKKQGIEDFNKVEKIELIADCFVEGKQKESGDIVSLKGNPKAQLLSSKRGVRVKVEDRTNLEIKAKAEADAKVKAETDAKAKAEAEAKKIADAKK